MKACPHCNAISQDDAAVCSSCGQPLLSQSQVSGCPQQPSTQAGAAAFPEWNTLSVEMQQRLARLPFETQAKFFKLSPQKRSIVEKRRDDAEVALAIEALSSSSRGGTLLTVGIIGTVIAAIVLVKWAQTSSVEGQLKATGGSVGEFTFKPGECKSGDRRNFYGVTVLGAEKVGGQLVLMDDPVRGKLVVMTPPPSCRPAGANSCKRVTFRESDCATLLLSLETTDPYEKNSKIRGFDGHARIECQSKDAGRLSGDIKFEDCW